MLIERLRRSALQEADLFGVADLSLARDAVENQGGPRVAQYPRAVSVGIVLMSTIVDSLPSRTDRAVAVSYRHHGYEIVNQRLDLLTSRLASALQREGFKAFPVPASRRVDDDRICALFSHKMAAHLAGLGWIGKSCLLVTPDYGPRVRWSSVLTDAPLETGKPMESRCGGCTACIEACPIQAFHNRPFREDEPREARYDARRCERYLEDLEATTRFGVCGMCVYACPHGMRASGGSASP